MHQGYTSLLTLFQEGTLSLTNNMTISVEVCDLLDQVAEEAMSRNLVAIPGGQAIELLNRHEVIAQQVPYVSIIAEEKGTLSLPACQLKLVSFNEIVERLLPAIKTFELFLYNQQLPNRHAYRRNLVAWAYMNAALVTHYRNWLPQYIPESEHATKLEAITLYCQLAAQDGHLSEDNLDAIINAIDKPLPRQSRRSRAKKE